jgi:hypothetical protein
MSRPTERPMTTPLFLLRCLQVGLKLDDLDKLEIGLVNDMFVEMANDHAEWAFKATQEDMNAF